MSERPRRRELMRPVQLLGLALVAALFAGVVTLVSMGFFQQRGGEQVPRALFMAVVVAGITFIVTLVVIALLVLAVDPAQVQKTIDRPVLLPPEDGAPDASSPDVSDAPGAPDAAGTPPPPR